MVVDLTLRVGQRAGSLPWGDPVRRGPVTAAWVSIRVLLAAFAVCVVVGVSYGLARVRSRA